MVGILHFILFLVNLHAPHFLAGLLSSLVFWAVSVLGEMGTSAEVSAPRWIERGLGPPEKKEIKDPK